MAEPLFIDISPDGIFATHPDLAELPVKVATTTCDDLSKHNTARLPLVSIGCWGVPDNHFEFDSSFITAQIQPGAVKFAALRDRLTVRLTDGTLSRPPISLFGHTDPVGTDDYNKVLSGRRALAMFGLLTQNPAIWDRLYSEPVGGDNWQKNSLKIIRGALQIPDGTSVSRTDLFSQYMQFLAGALKLDSTDFLARLADAGGKGDYQGCSRFNPLFLLSQQEEDKFKNETPENKQARDSLNEKNRRVLVFLFEPGSQVDPTTWPCPRVKENSDACKTRFWSGTSSRLALTKVQSRDGETRRSLRYPNARREYGKVATVIDEHGNPALDANGQPTPVLQPSEDEETFACRFYYGVALHSPCEGAVKLWKIQFLIEPPVFGKDINPVANRRFVVIAGSEEDAPVMRGQTNEKGEMFIPVFDQETKMTLKLDAWETLYGTLPEKSQSAPSDTSSGDQTEDPEAFPDEDKFIVYHLDAGALAKLQTTSSPPVLLPVQQRLFNLGYGLDSFTTDAAIQAWSGGVVLRGTDLAIRQFQHDQGLPEDGVANEDTQLMLFEVHRS